MELYTEDRLGLREMNEKGKLIFLTAPNATHLEMDEEWFVENILIHLKWEVLGKKYFFEFSFWGKLLWFSVIKKLELEEHF